MKRSVAFALFAFALTICFVLSRLSVAQAVDRVRDKEKTADSYYGLHALESFATYLQDTKQTNILQRFNDYENTRITSESSAEMGVLTAILLRLRDGRTNEAMTLLEMRMTSDAITFAVGYRELAPPVRDTVSLVSLNHARDYYFKYGVKDRLPEVDQYVTNAFKLLDEKDAK
jgi:hypothetical protein